MELCTTIIGNRSVRGKTSEDVRRALAEKGKEERNYRPIFGLGLLKGQARRPSQGGATRRFSI